MAICEQCGKDYESKRATSRFCSDACRLSSYRRKEVSVSSEAELSVSGLSVASPQSMHRKCGPIPGDPDYDGVAHQAKYQGKWARPELCKCRPNDPELEPVTTMALPDYVPAIIKAKYIRAGAEYRATIHCLITTDVEDLLSAGVYVPVWRHQAHAMA